MGTSILALFWHWLSFFHSVHSWALYEVRGFPISSPPPQFLITWRDWRSGSVYPWEEKSNKGYLKGFHGEKLKIYSLSCQNARHGTMDISYRNADLNCVPAFRHILAVHQGCFNLESCTKQRLKVMLCDSLQVYSRASSILSSSPQRNLNSEVDGDQQFNLNGNSVPTITQALMTMYRRRSPEEFNPKLVGWINIFLLLVV